MLGDDVELTATPREDDVTEGMALAQLLSWIGFRTLPTRSGAGFTEGRSPPRGIRTSGESGFIS